MSIKCKGCLHESACKAWISHGELLYDDFSYSVEGCKEYAPVVHGRWFEFNTMMSCSECDKDWYYTDNNCDEFRYCPNCGAKMDLEVE